MRCSSGVAFGWDLKLWNDLIRLRSQKGGRGERFEWDKKGVA